MTIGEPAGGLHRVCGVMWLMTWVVRRIVGMWGGRGERNELGGEDGPLELLDALPCGLQGTGPVCTRHSRKMRKGVFRYAQFCGYSHDYLRTMGERDGFCIARMLQAKE